MLQLISWLILAAVHIVPAIAFFRPSLLTSLYGIEPTNGLFLLMQHRAALFLAVALSCLWAAFHAESRQLAAIIVGISMLTFIALYFMAGSPKPLRTIAITDMAGLPFLAYAAYSAFKSQT